MDKFKHKLLIRTAWLFVCLVITAGSYTALRFILSDSLRIPDFIRDYQNGFLFIMSVQLLLAIARNLLNMGNDEKLKKQYIRETDERNMMVRQKSASAAMPVIIYGLGIAIIVAGFFNEMVFFTLIGVLFFIGFIVGGLKIFYNWLLG